MTITPEKLRELADQASSLSPLMERKADWYAIGICIDAMRAAADDIERLRRAYPMQVLPLHPIPTDEEYQKAFEEAQRTPSFGKKP